MKIETKNKSRKNIEKVITILSTDKKDKTMLESLKQKGPFYVLISTILSVRNKDAQTTIASKNLLEKYKTPKELANAELSDIEILIKKSGMYKTKSVKVKETAKILVSEFDGKVPNNIDDLLRLPGVGRKVANCVLVYSFDIPAIPVDVHVHRITNRLGWISTKNPNQTEIELKKIVPKKLWTQVNEDFVVHGQNVCKPITPLCSICMIEKFCKKINVKSYK